MEKQPWCHSGNNTCFLQYLNKWENLSECETQYDCSLRDVYYQTKGINTMALNLNNNTVSAKVNGVDLSAIENLLVERFKSISMGNNNNMNAISVLSTEVKELRNTVNKLIEETKQLNAAFVLAAKISSSPIEKKIETAKTEVKATNNYIALGNKIKSIDNNNSVEALKALKEIRESNSPLFDGIILKGNPNYFGAPKIEELKNKFLAIIAPTAIGASEELKPIANIESWSKALKVGQDQLRKIVDSIRESKDLLCKSDFEEIREFLGKEALPNPFINWLESVQRSARK